MPYFKNKQIDLYFEIEGRDDPLILIAGIGCDISHWHKIRDILARRYQVIMLDNRGVGRSQKYELDYSIQDMAEDVIALLDHLNISRADILGHSMGGAVAQYLGYEYPERINRLIISHSFIKFRPSSLMACEHYHALSKLKLNPKIIATGLFPFIYSDDFLSNENNITDTISVTNDSDEEMRLLSFQQQIDTLASIDTEKYLRHIHSETFIIGGRDDKFTPIVDSVTLNEKIFSSKLMIISGAHAPMIETPEDYANIILSYLRNKMATVLEVHKNEFLKPISLKTGDDVIVGNEDLKYTGWVYCTAIKNNISGWVPKQLINCNYADGGVLTEDYSAVELNVIPNQMVIVEKELNDWGWCFDGEKHGWLPLNKLSR